jgi:hypothetical protein
LQVFEMSGHCVLQVVVFHRTGWVVLVLGLPMLLWLFMAQGECTSVFSVALLV